MLVVGGRKAPFPPALAFEEISVDAERYDPQQVEPKWVAAWEELALYRSDEGDTSRPRFYALDMFPYPSGDCTWATWRRSRRRRSPG